MLPIIKTLVVTLAKNLFGMLLTKHMIMWAVEKAAGYTDNLLDDHAVDLVRAGLDNDVEGVKTAITNILADLDTTKEA